MKTGKTGEVNEIIKLHLYLVFITKAAQAMAGLCGKTVISKRHYSSLSPTLLFKAQGC